MSGTGNGPWCWWIFNISSTSKCLQSRPYIWKDSPPKYSYNTNILSRDILRNGDDIVWCTLTHVHSMITHIAEISPRGDHNFGSTKMASVPGFLRHGTIENFTQPKAMKSTIWITMAIYFHFGCLTWFRYRVPNKSLLGTLWKVQSCKILATLQWFVLGPGYKIFCIESPESWYPNRTSG